MACIDYGAIMKVNGEFVNKNSEWWPERPVWAPEYADYNGEPMEVYGFIYAGDAECFLTFYKGYCRVISDNKCTFIGNNDPFLSRTYLNLAPGIKELKISFLEKMPIVEKWCHEESWSEYVRTHYRNATGNEPLNQLQDGRKAYRDHLRRCRRWARLEKQGKLYTYHTCRFVAEWEYKGDKYEVIFGYGIDPDEPTYKRLKEDNAYGFTENEIRILDEWFYE